MSDSSERRRLLAGLLASCFTIEELRSVVAESVGLGHALNWNSAANEVVFQFVDALDRHGRIDADLFETISRVRPARGVEVAAVAEAWGHSGASEEAEGPAGAALLHVEVERLVSAPPREVFEALRDHVPQIAALAPSVVGCESLYRREQAPGVWASHMWRYGTAHPAMASLSRMLTPEWARLANTVHQHGVFDEEALRALWSWENPLFAAWETLEFYQEPGGCRLSVAADVRATITRGVKDSSLRMVLGAFVAGSPRLMSRVIRSNIEDFLVAVDRYVTGRTPPRHTSP